MYKYANYVSVILLWCWQGRRQCWRSHACHHFSSVSNTNRLHFLYYVSCILTSRDTLAPCPLTCSFGWCLAEGYRNGDQCRPVGPCGSGRTLALVLQLHISALIVFFTLGCHFWQWKIFVLFYLVLCFIGKPVYGGFPLTIDLSACLSWSSAQL